MSLKCDDPQFAKLSEVSEVKNEGRVSVQLAAPKSLILPETELQYTWKIGWLLYICSFWLASVDLVLWRKAIFIAIT